MGALTLDPIQREIMRRKALDAFVPDKQLVAVVRSTMFEWGDTLVHVQQDEPVFRYLVFRMAYLHCPVHGVYVGADVPAPDKGRVICPRCLADWLDQMRRALLAITREALAVLHRRRIDALANVHHSVQWMYARDSYYGAEWVPLGENPPWNPDVS